MAVKLPSIHDFVTERFEQFDFCSAGDKRNSFALGLQARALDAITPDLISNPTTFSAQALLALELLVCCE